MWYNTKQEEPINVLECVRLISWENENEKWPNVPFWGVRSFLFYNKND